MVSRIASQRTGSPRRGRPRAEDVAQRRLDVLQAAVDELVEVGVANTTMASIASRAGASKETLYAWFDSREGLLAAIIRHNADQAADRVRGALANTDDPEQTLVGFGTGLLRMLTAPPSLAINRAAMTDPALAAELLASGRHRVGPIVEEYLADIAAAGHITLDDPADGFETFYGLLMRDTQIRCLLGEPSPDDMFVAARASDAVSRFMALHAPRI